MSVRTRFAAESDAAERIAIDGEEASAERLGTARTRRLSAHSAIYMRAYRLHYAHDISVYLPDDIEQRPRPSSSAPPLWRELKRRAVIAETLTDSRTY